MTSIRIGIVGAPQTGKTTFALLGGHSIFPESLEGVTTIQSYWNKYPSKSNMFCSLQHVIVDDEKIILSFWEVDPVKTTPPKSPTDYFLEERESIKSSGRTSTSFQNDQNSDSIHLPLDSSELDNTAIRSIMDNSEYSSFEKNLPFVNLECDPDPTAFNNALKESTKKLPMYHSFQGQVITTCPAADVLIVCYEITRPQTFIEAINVWIPAIKKKFPNIPFILVGTMIDKLPRQIAKIGSELFKNASHASFSHASFSSNSTFNLSGNLKSSSPFDISQNQTPSDFLKYSHRFESTSSRRKEFPDPIQHNFVHHLSANAAARSLGAVNHFQTSSFWSKTLMESNLPSTNLTSVQTVILHAIRISLVHKKKVYDFDNHVPCTLL